MTLAALNARINALPPAEREEARYLRDERFGMLCAAGEPTKEAVDMVAWQLFREGADLF